MTDTPSDPPGLWFVTWGSAEVHFTRDYHMIGGVPFVQRRSLHERLSERINWRLADAVEFFCWGMVNPSMKFLRGLQPKLCLIEDRLRGYDD